MKLETCVFFSPKDTNSLQVKITEPNAQGEVETIQWLFTFDNKMVLTEWLLMLEQEKHRLVEDKTGEKGAGFIHDTLLDAVQMKPPQKEEEKQNETILKPE